MTQKEKKRKRVLKFSGPEEGKRPKKLEVEKALLRIKELERGIQASRTEYNNIVALLDYLKQNESKIVHAAIHALHRVFVPILQRGELRRDEKGKGVTDTKPNKLNPLTTVRIWLRANYVRFVNRLCTLLGHREPGLQLPALAILLELLRSETAYLTSVSGTHHFSNNHYYRVIAALLDNDNFCEALQEEFVLKYLNVYDDLRYFFLKDAAKIINLKLDCGTSKDKSGPVLKKRKTSEMPDGPTLNNLMENTFSILEDLRRMPTDQETIDKFWTGHPAPELSEAHPAKGSDSESNDSMSDIGDISPQSLSNEDEKSKPKETDTTGELVHKPVLPILRLSAHHRVFQECWLALLKLPMTEASYKQILLIMHKKIMPYMLKPTLLMDFLTDAYNAGGGISLLALNGLFTLIHEYNLDYPDFYKKLYSLFDRNLMHVKYRSRFFRLVDLFLASTYLPVQLVASFIKRMSRLALSSPPHGTVIVIPMIYNLMRRHPGCMVLVHRVDEDASEDPYDMDETDPMNTNAISSSLWELKTLQEHYYPNVAILAKIFQEQFTKPSYNVEDFLDHTYASLFDTEVKRRPKKNKPPTLAFEKPKFLFTVLAKDETETQSTNGEGWESWRF